MGWGSEATRGDYVLNAGGGPMKEFVEFIAKHLVDKPDAVVLDMQEQENKTVFKLTVAENDVGKLIGRKGRTASAFRVLLRAVAAKEGKRAILDIVG